MDGLVLRIFIMLAMLQCTGALRKCMKCDRIPTPRLCDSITTCAQDEICYAENIPSPGPTLYTSGCMSKMQCQSGNLIGKRSPETRDSHRVECCDKDYCNLAAFGLTDIPMTVRGPHCMSGSYLTDPTLSTQIQTCRHDQLCTVEPIAFSGNTFYNQKCIDKLSCSAIHPHTTCEMGSCCGGDFCNDRCDKYTTQAPTANFADKLRAKCLSQINDGYFYDQYTNLCVRLVKSHGLFNRAQADNLCKSDGAELMTINSQDEQDFLLSWIFSHRANDTDFWIGAKANVSKSHVYYWQDGTMASGAGVYNHWSGKMMGQPDDRRLHNENCVYINDKDRYFWHDDVCTAQRTGYMCEIWNVTGDKVPVCRQRVFDGFFYDTDTDMCVMFRESPRARYTHTAAATECAKYGATLAIIDSHEKMDFTLKWIFSNHQNATDYWIGAQDIHNTSEFYWPNGQKLNYAHWGGPVFPPEVHGQPDAAYGVTNENCVFMNHEHDFLWFDDKCANHKTGYICQYFGSSHNTTKHECFNRLNQGYFYDEASNMCASVKGHHSVDRYHAKNACVAENADLAVVDTQNKMDFTWELIYFTKLNDTDFWIGGRESGNNQFVWEPTGQKFVYTNWYTIAPARPEDCAILDHIDIYRWKTADCQSQVHGYVCQINEYTMNKCSARPADIIYLLDSSGSEAASGFNRMKELLANVTNRLIKQSFDVSFGAATFSSHVASAIQLGTVSNKNVISAIRNIPYNTGASYTNLALHYATSVFTSSNSGARINAEKIVVVVTDGRSSNVTSTLQEANLLHAVADVVAVEFGRSVDEAHLKNISSSGTVVVASVDSIAAEISDLMKYPTGCTL